ncbi:MAG TPA: transketolase [Clostridia bacterium]|nr:transketolase [Clostridia bacterium]
MELIRYANDIRIRAVDAIYHAQSGHPGGSLSCADILAVLYGRVLNLRPQEPRWPDRDRFVLSKGHAAPAYYAALALRGFFPVEALRRLRQADSFLQGHPCMVKVPGVDMSSGSLGQGLSAANGMALVAKAQGRAYRSYCLVGDGEMQEGQFWEAAMSAAHYALDALTLLVDNNGLQIDGRVSGVMNLLPIAPKLRAFGWHVREVDGHDTQALLDALGEARAHSGAPSAIVCRTVKGKGVPYMENQAGWHGAVPNDAQYRQAMEALGVEGGRL